MKYGERIRQMAMGRMRPSRATFPFIDGEPEEIGIRLLTDAQIDRAKMDAVQWVRTKADALKIEPYELLSIEGDIIDREQKRRIIYFAIVDVDTIDDPEPKPYFEMPGQIEQLDAMTVGTLMELYIEHQNAMNPLHGLDEGAVGELAEALGKLSEDPKGPTTELALALYDAATLRILARFLLAQRKTQKTGK